MMADRTIQERVIDVLKEQTSVVSIDPTFTFRGDLNFDSLDIVETTLMVEEEFGFQIDEEDVGKFDTVGQLVVYMEGRING
jgi:acyl carrier protein